MFESIDQALKYLFNQAAKHPLAVKKIFFSDGGKVDAQSIRATLDYNNSRIPTESITLARETLSQCYNAIDDQMTSLFFIYYYGYLDGYKAQIIDGLVILTEQQAALIDVVLNGYRNKSATPLSELAKQFNLDYTTADNYCRKIRKHIAKLHAGVWESTEQILIDKELI